MRASSSRSPITPRYIHMHDKRVNEKLDPRSVYVKDGPRFFKVGRVFKCLWTEPAGKVVGDDTPHINSIQYGEKAFSKVRYFVVVQEKRGCCLCISMRTFGKKGLTKRGIDLSDYAAVYAEGHEANYLIGERLVKEPLSIKVETKGQNIDPMSRLNFSRIYTVEHNIKVLKVGRVSSGHLDLLKRYFVDSVTSAEPVQTEIGSTMTNQPSEHGQEEAEEDADFNAVMVEVPLSRRGRPR